MRDFPSSRTVPRPNGSPQRPVDGLRRRSLRRGADDGACRARACRRCSARVVLDRGGPAPQACSFHRAGRPCPGGHLSHCQRHLVAEPGPCLRHSCPALCRDRRPPHHGDLPPPYAGTGVARDGYWVAGRTGNSRRNPLLRAADRPIAAPSVDHAWPGAASRRPAMHENAGRSHDHSMRQAFDRSRGCHLSCRTIAISRNAAM